MFRFLLLTSAFALLPGAPAEPGALREGAKLELEVAPGDVRRIDLDLQTGDYLYVLVTQHTIDVAVSLLDKEGRELYRCDVQGRRSGDEAIPWISEVTGRHTVQVEANPSVPRGGRYTFEVQALHPASDEERKKAELEGTYLRAFQLANGGDADARRRAIELYRSVLPLARELEPIQEASILNNVGFNLKELGRFDEALTSYRMALSRWRELGEESHSSDTLLNLGSIHSYLGEYEQAIDYSRQALDIRQRTGSARRELEAARALARRLRDQGATAEALAVLTALLGRRRAEGDSVNEAYALSALAGHHRRAGDLQKALDSYDRALQIFEAEAMPRGQAEVLNNIALVHRRLGQIERTRESFGRSLEINRRLGSRISQAIILTNLGSISLSEGEHESAIRDLRSALAIYEEIGHRPREVYPLTFLAEALVAVGRKEEALAAVETALGLAPPGSRFAARARHGAGVVHAELGDCPGAFPHLEAGLSLSREAQDRQGERRARTYLAECYRKLGDLELARQHLEAVLALKESTRTLFRSLDSRARYLATGRETYERYVDLLLDLDERHPGGGYDARAFQAAESGRARSFVERLAEERLDVDRDVDPGLKARELELEARVTALQSELIAIHRAGETDEDRLPEVQRALDRADEERIELESTIRREHPRYASLRYPQPLGLDEVQPTIPEGVALLEYTLGEERSSLFVVTRSGLWTYRLPDAGAIQKHVEQLKPPALGRGRRGAAAYGAAAHALYQQLVAPAEEVLRDLRELWISPDRELYYLAFEALVTSPPQRPGYSDLAYLVRRWAVSYLPSATASAALSAPRATRAAHTTAFLGIGDPSYGSPEDGGDEGSGAVMRGLYTERGGWRPERLVESGREVRGIAALFPPAAARVYTGDDATEDLIKSGALGGARWVHLATHGEIREDRPYRSSLVLTLDDDPLEDGLLQAYEIFGLELSADLVVLSACRTGLGENLRGEGIVGLSHAFFYAGARRIVVSLWQVSDRSTADLMIGFYRHLTGGSTTARALRLAKLEMIERPAQASPFYWAPFVVFGRDHGAPAEEDPGAIALR